MDEFETKGLTDEIVRFVSILPEVFSDDLDRKTLWERIGNGIITSLAKAGGDFGLFINSCLDYVKADSGKVAANENLSTFINSALIRPREWKTQFLTVIEKKYYLIVVKARARWNENKGDK
jgi:hypothetical protein